MKITKKQVHVLRFILGVLIALFAGIDSMQANRGLLNTCLLPGAILLLVTGDLIGYLSEGGDKDKPQSMRRDTP